MPAADCGRVTGHSETDPVPRLQGPFPLALNSGIFTHQRTFPRPGDRHEDQSHHQRNKLFPRRGAEAAPHLLIHYLREVVGLTGSHVGCETSLCGACTVELNGKAVKSCTMFAVQADGASVVTVEGLATDGKLHPVQEAFWNEHGLQCGFCTPGMIMASKQILDRNAKPTEEEIRHGLEGNVCRCTGYQHIVNAVKAAAAGAGK